MTQRETDTMTDDTTGEDTGEKTVGELLAEESPEAPDDPVEALYEHAAAILDIQRAMEDSTAREHTVDAMNRLEDAAAFEQKTREQLG